MGAHLADLEGPDSTTAASGLANLRGLIGLVAIIGSRGVPGPENKFPGPWALLPVAGANADAFVAKFHGKSACCPNRPMIGLGLISYPLYLWHWPLLTYLAILRNGVPNFLEIWAASSPCRAFLPPFKYIEVPLRRRKGVIPKLCFARVNRSGWNRHGRLASGFEFRFPPELRDIARVRVEHPGISRSLLARCPRHDLRRQLRRRR